MLNNFSRETVELFDMGGYMKDWEDGMNDANACHHILKRVSNSPYNLAPLNNKRNHLSSGRKGLRSIHSFEVQCKYLLKTKRYLESISYKPTDKDLEFLNTYKKYYVF